MTDVNEKYGGTSNSARNPDQDPDTPHARRVAPMSDDHDQLHKMTDAEDRQEALVDEGVEETFPASDPVSAKRIT